jgi:hypothetical protein
MDEEYGSLHTYELDENRWIQVEVTRRWPKYVAAWSIRQRSGDTDFPVVSGEVECMPPRDPSQLEHDLDALRENARGQAMAALAQTEPVQAEKRGFFSRLFGG